MGADFEDSTLATNNAPLTGTANLTNNGTTSYYVANAVDAGTGGFTKIYIDGTQDATANLPTGGQNGLTPNTGGTQKVGIGAAVNTSGTITG
jgi:hypothetical protein